MNDSNKKRIGILFVLIGALLFSAKAVVVKLTYQYPLGALTSLFFRMLFAFPFLLFLALRQDIPKITKKDWLKIFWLGVLGYYAASYFDFLGLQYITAGLERIILFVYPTLVLGISWISGEKHPSRNEVFSLGLTYLGVALAYGSDSEWKMEGKELLGAIFIFLSALTYAFYLVGSGDFVPKIGASRFTSYALLTSSLLVFLQFLVFGNWGELHQESSFYFLGFLLGTFHTVIPAVLVSHGVGRIGARTAAIVASIGPICTLFLGHCLLGERITVVHFVGTLFVLVGVFKISSK